MDGGYGAVPGAESHAGQSMYCLDMSSDTFTDDDQKVFCCVGALEILRKANKLPDALKGLNDSPVTDVDTLAHFLAERQLPCGGLNGRPEKLEDVNFYTLF